MAKAVKQPVSVDERLTGHLHQAEEHLIEAVKLFAEQPRLERRVGYLTRLVRAQELTTGLYREELVRVRGSKRGKK